MAAMLAIIGTGIQAAGMIAQGRAAKAQAEYQAKIAEKQAADAFASKQREALVKEHERDLTISKARAVAAASGAGVETPSVLSTIGDIFSQGDLNARYSMWEGENNRNLLIDQANAYRMKGRDAYNSSILSGIGTMASGATKAFYG